MSATETSLEETDLIQKAARNASMMAMLMAVIKLVLYFSTGSLMVGLSAWDSSIDTIISFINGRVIRFARQDADEEHPYGHGKAEYIAALAQGCMIVGGAITIFVAAIKSIFSDTMDNDGAALVSTITASLFFIGFAIGSAIITIYVKQQGKKHGSPALIADSEHYSVDVATNLVTALSLILVDTTGIAIFDEGLSICLSMYLGFGGVKLILENVQFLLDKALPAGMKVKVAQAIFKLDERILEIHRFRGRVSGHKLFFDFHLCLPKTLTFEEAHDITEIVELEIGNAFNADVVAHADPFDGRAVADSILRPKGDI